MKVVFLCTLVSTFLSLSLQNVSLLWNWQKKPKKFIQKSSL
jgi:hypothetical protein